MGLQGDKSIIENRIERTICYTRAATEYSLRRIEMNTQLSLPLSVPAPSLPPTLPHTHTHTHSLNLLVQMSVGTVVHPLFAGTFSREDR